MTPTAEFIQKLKSAACPTDSDLVALMTALHDKLVDEPLMLWLDKNFEDMADSITRASKCLTRESQQTERD